MAEWSTAGDGRVCPQCSDLEDVVLTVDEARGLIPRHPRCRCTFVPYVPSVEGKVKNRRRKLLNAIKRSVKKERPKLKTKSAIRKSKWLGADLLKTSK